MTIPRDAVLWGFRLLLGREPAEAEVAPHLKLANEAALVEALLRSPEFAAHARFDHLLRLREGAGVSPPKLPHVSRSTARITLFGNCQAAGVGRAIQALTGGARVRVFEATPSLRQRLADGAFDIGEIVDASDLVLLQPLPEIVEAIRRRRPRAVDAKLRHFPAIAFGGFHPDCVYVQRADGGNLVGPMGEYHSSIAYWAWEQGLAVEQAQALFRPEVYEALAFDEAHRTAVRLLLRRGRAAGLPLAPLLDRWRAQGCWMHTVNHPKAFVLADIAEALLRREDIRPIAGAGQWIDDGLAAWPVWPLYPGLAERHGLEGALVFKLDRGRCPAHQPVLTLSLPRFLEAEFEAFEAGGRGAIGCARVAGERYARLAGLAGAAPSRLRAWAGRLGGRRAAAPVADAAPAQPYDGLPDERFWRSAVAACAPEAIDPVIAPGFVLSKADRIATAGSCFAQHIGRALAADGYAPMIAEADVPADAAEARRRGYGVYTARYGNVYTARQLVQLFDRAHGDFRPLDRAWLRDDGRHVDPFRPRVEPDGHAGEDEVRAARRAHLADVRRMFASLDVFVFTLGLTEAWRRRGDGAVYPVAPGVAGGRYDPAAHEFVNFGHDEVLADLRGFVARLHAVNPAARMIVTVSPVPLVATWEKRHVLVSTAHSKAVLRAAAGALAASEAQVDYFPSYEIVTGAAARGAYFEPDLRSVSEAGVRHVMRVFLRHYGGGAADSAGVPASPRLSAAEAASFEAEEQALSALVCDEEAIERHRR